MNGTNGKTKYNEPESKDAHKVPLTRDQIRAELLGKKRKAKRKPLALWGVDIELKQASLGDILLAKEEEDEHRQAVDMLVKYAVVPGTDERIFEPEDAPTILQWPFGEELLALQTAVAELTGVDLAAIEAELGGNPLKERPSNTP